MLATTRIISSMAAHDFVFVACLVFLGISMTAGQDTECQYTECISIITNQSDIWLGCFFPVDLNSTTPKKEVSIRRFNISRLNLRNYSESNADPVLACNWRDNGEVVCQASEGYEQIGEVSDRLKVRIKDPKPRHEGEYMCLIVDHAAKPIPCVLKLPDYPDSPSQLNKVNSSVSTATIQWTAGDAGFRKLPQSFRVRYKKVSTPGYKYADVIPPNATTYTITGLDPGSEYEVTVQAFNRRAESKFQTESLNISTQGLDTVKDTRIAEAIGGTFVVTFFVTILFCGVLFFLLLRCKGQQILVCIQGNASPDSQPQNPPAGPTADHHGEGEGMLPQV